jgi:hypothetical protein
MTATQAPAGNPERMQLMWDTHCIEQILARYVPAIDGALADVVAADFTEDGVFDLGPIGVFQGRDEIRGFIARDSWSADQLAQIARGGGHFLSPPMIVIEGDNAVATCTSQFYLRDGGAYTMLRLTAVRLELQRVGDGWKIVRRVNRLIDHGGEGIALYRQAFDGSPASAT